VIAIAFRPESQNGLLFVHIFAAMTLFGGVLVASIAGIAASRRDSPREIFILSRIAWRTDVFVTYPSLVVLFAAGAVLAHKQDAFSTAWVQAGIGLTLFGALMGGGVLAWLGHRVMKQAATLVASGVEHSEELRRAADNPISKALGPPLLLIFPVLFWLMTAKP
jgi:uncharacterized membrane protein